MGNWEGIWGLFSLSTATSLEEGKLWIQINYSLMKNWTCVTLRLWQKGEFIICSYFHIIHHITLVKNTNFNKKKCLLLNNRMCTLNIFNFKLVNNKMCTLNIFNITLVNDKMCTLVGITESIYANYIFMVSDYLTLSFDIFRIRV